MIDDFERTFSITDDANTDNTVAMRVRRGAYGITVDLMVNEDVIAGISADYFEDTFRVIAHKPESYGGGDPDVNVVLVEKVSSLR